MIFLTLLKIKFHYLLSGFVIFEVEKIASVFTFVQFKQVNEPFLEM